MNILVTGGAGYIGSVLVPMLLNDGHYVTVLDRLSFGIDPIAPLFANPRFTFIRGDVANIETVTLATRKADVVIHLAAVVGAPACAQDLADARHTNEGGTDAILRAAGPDKHIIYASSVSVYGKQPEGTVATEETELNPLSLYARTKVAGEGMFKGHNNATILRFATVHGLSPRMRLDLLVNDLTFQAVHTGNLVVYQREAVRAGVHVHDAATAIQRAIDGVNTRGTFNVVSSCATKADIVDFIAKHTEAKVFFGEGSDLDGRDCVVSNRKILTERHLWLPRYSLPDAVEQLTKAFKHWDIPNKYRNS